MNIERGRNEGNRGRTVKQEREATTKANIYTTRDAVMEDVEEESALQRAWTPTRRRGRSKRCND